MWYHGIWHRARIADLWNNHTFIKEKYEAGENEQTLQDHKDTFALSNFK